jgi:ribonuclease H2 subunit A
MSQSQRVTRSQSALKSQLSQSEPQSQKQTNNTQPDSDNDDDDDDDDDNNDDNNNHDESSSRKPIKTTTTKRAPKRAYPPFEVKMPQLMSYNSYLQRPLYGDIRPWDKQTNGFDMTEPCMVGIDEAGRGPVLGPMIYGTCIVPLSKVDELKALGVNDSKQLKKIDREYLFSIVQGTGYLRWLVDRISPLIVSIKMLAAYKESLNLTSHLSALHMVCTYIKLGFNVQEVYADTVGPPEKYKAWMENEISEFCRRNKINNPVVKIVVESKADATYPVVSAASICAKVTRDLDLEKWVCREETIGGDNKDDDCNDDDDDCNDGNKKKFKVTHDFGSGYPGDEVTKSWLRQHFDPVFGFPDLVRFSWDTAEKIMEEDGYAVRWGEEEDLPSRQATEGRQKGTFAFVKEGNPNTPCQWKWLKGNNVTVTTELPF